MNFNFTNGKQFKYYSNGQQYIGYYTKAPNNDYYTGKNFNFKDSVKLIRIEKQLDKKQQDYNVDLYNRL